MNPLRMEIKSSEISERKGIAKGTGNPYHLREQVGYLALANKPYPVEVRFLLGKDQPPLGVGSFEVDVACFYVTRDGKVACDLSKASRLDRPARAA